VMRPVPDTRKMQLRFQLYSRANAAPAFSPVIGGDLGTWITPKDPTLGQRPGDVWNLQKQVADLLAPATYRFRVSFRWLGVHGHVLATAMKLSAMCFQPELRPDLLVESFTAQAIPRQPNENRYIATIRNDGATAAGPFEVLFAPGGVAPVKTKQVAGLASKARIALVFVGPVCNSAAPPTVTVDPTDQVDDFNRANNTAAAVCS
jgi:CARDB